MTPRFPKALVIGASSGLGAEIALQLAAEGSHVAIVGRRLDRLQAIQAKFPEQMHAVQHDVTQFDAAPELFESICRTLGGLDLIVYCAGVMPRVEPLGFDFSLDLPMIETNFAGAVAWLNLAAERFAGTRTGTIVAIGSVAGDRGRQGQPVYNASKAALATYVEALRNRLHRLGVTVVTIKPGPMDTEMTAGLNLSKALSPKDAATKVLKLSRSSGEKYLSPVHAVLFGVIRHIPGFLFRRMKL